MKELFEQRMVLHDGKVIVRAYTRDGFEGFKKMVAWCRQNEYPAHKVWLSFAHEDGKYAHEPRHYGAESAPIICDERPS